MKIKFSALLFCVLAISLTAIAQERSLSGDEAVNQAKESWRATMHQMSIPGEGCFHASFPALNGNK